MAEGAGEREGQGGFHAGPNKHREAQIMRRPERKLFDRKAKEDFLGWYAASGNCVWAAEKAGFDDGTVWRHRASDPDFAEAFDRAAEQGVARAKVTMLESKMRSKPYRIEEGREVPEFEVDPEIAMQLIKEHERAEGRTPGRRGKQGRAPRVASNAEVDAALTKRMKAYLRRLQQGGGSGWPAGGEGERG
jgi:hypothetical protein